MGQYEGPYFYHQFGYGDGERCYEMLQNGYGHGVILSPQKLKDHLLTRWSSKYANLKNVHLLIDPEFYAPSDIPHNRQVSSRVDTTRALADNQLSNVIVKDYLDRQHILNATEFIIPGIAAGSIDNQWLETLTLLCRAGRSWLESNASGHPVFATLAISHDIVANASSRRSVLNRLVGLDVDGYYLAVELKNDTLPSDENFIVGLLDLIYRLKINGKKVLLSRSDYWAVLCFPFGLDRFASGARQDSRKFKVTKFRPDLSEKPPYIPFRRPVIMWSSKLMGGVRFPDDAALLYEQGIWQELDNQSPYAKLFDGTPPTEIAESKNFKEGDSFQNYAWQMWNTAQQFQTQSPLERIELVRDQLSHALSWHSTRQQRGISYNNGINASHLRSWLSGFNTYLTQVQDELLSEFS